MAAPTTRPFRLTDLMTLIAALAFGFGIVREGARKARASGFRGYILTVDAPEWLIGPPPPGSFFNSRYVWIPLGDWSSGDWATRVMGAWTTLGPCLLAVTIAAIWLRMARPRPKSSELWRLPGWVGTLVAASIMGLALAPCGYFALRTGSGLWILDLFEYAVVFAPIVAGVCVVLVWIGMLVAGRWRAEGSWIDRLGLLIGLLYAIAGGFLAWYLITRF
jgi:hypothetical protein